MKISYDVSKSMIISPDKIKSRKYFFYSKYFTVPTSKFQSLHVCYLVWQQVKQSCVPFPNQPSHFQHPRQNSVLYLTYFSNEYTLVSCSYCCYNCRFIKKRAKNTHYLQPEWLQPLLQSILPFFFYSCSYLGMHPQLEAAVDIKESPESQLSNSSSGK